MADLYKPMRKQLEDTSFAQDTKKEEDLQEIDLAELGIEGAELEGGTSGEARAELGATGAYGMHRPRFGGGYGYGRRRYRKRYRNDCDCGDVVCCLGLCALCACCLDVID